MKNTFRRNLSFGFGLSLLILLLSSIASYISIDNLLKSNRQVNNTNVLINELESLVATLVDAETGQRGFLLTGDAEFLDPYKGATQKTIAAMGIVKALLVTSSSQQENYNSLQTLIKERLNTLKATINLKNEGKLISNAELKKGKEQMDAVRSLVFRMQKIEQTSLEDRTERLNLFAIYTRLMIVIAALVSLIITIIFYVRVKKDFEERTRLQKELEDNERNISERIEMIHDIANKVSSGNYQVRISSDGKDTLGSLADSLNKMAESLQTSFDSLSEKEWLQTGLANLIEKMNGETNLHKLCSLIISFVAEYTNCQVGTFYVMENNAFLKLYGGYSFVDDGTRKEIALGEGLTGQCALNGRQLLLEGIDESSLHINYAAGTLHPKNVVAIPVFHEKSVQGVIELATIHEFSKSALLFLEMVSQRIGVVINNVQDRVKVQELLEETQSQSEELQMQHMELQNLNAELESNTEKLQLSEEELRVQQEDLMETNKELKERTYLLEEKNQIIEDRNVEIERKANELALSTKYKSEFLANMSHELRTPLNSILLLSGLMVANSENKLTDEHVDYAKVIQGSGNGLLSLIDEILDLSRIESGKMQLDYEVISLDDVIRSMNSLFTPFAKEKNIDFTIDLHPEVSETIETDRMRLEQILKNLLSNAMKFTPSAGSVKLTISSASNDNKYVIFAVKDTGIGIALEKQSLIYEAFQQADGSTRRKFGGTGLGLSISRELVKLLNGTIDLNSEVGKGSEFIISIPVVAENVKVPETKVTIEDRKIQDDTKTYLKTSGNDVAVPAHVDIPDDRIEIKPGDKLILIIEDDIHLAKVLLDFTRKNGYKGIVATRGDQGLELAKKFIPTAILLDIRLPVKNGWEVLEELKKDPKTMHIPVHIMSSNAYKNESIQKGADDFINKPLEFEKIKGILEKMQDADASKVKKVIIVEEDVKHAKALAYFLESSHINAEIKHSLGEGIESLMREEVDCVILDGFESDPKTYEKLEKMRNAPGHKDFPIIVFTSAKVAAKEDIRLKNYTDSVVIKTTFSYKRILDEVSLFLHVVDRKKRSGDSSEIFSKFGALNDVLKNKTVLIADDDVRNIFSMTKALELYKVNVIAAMDGREALGKLDENPEIDIILMDMMMPEMDGYDATIHIRNNDKLKDIPVIAVTAKAMAGDREKCIQAGASDYITKPVDIDQLVSLLRVWLYESQFNKN